jgi:hypothetical protein
MIAGLEILSREFLELLILLISMRFYKYLQRFKLNQIPIHA